MYRGASAAMRMLLEIRPAVLAMEMSMALVKARALRLGMLETIQALLMGDMGYAWEQRYLG
jgi:hypothetical protein